jgi:hypothetical protein
MVVGKKLLIESLNGAVRKTLVRERIRAMRGDVDDAVRILDHAAELVGAERPRERVALGMLRAELLHLNRQDREALQLYRDRVLPLKERLDAEEQFVLDQNLADLEMAVWSREGGDTFYSLVDRRRLAGFEWFDAEDILEAQDAAAKGKHYEALPIIWRHAVRAYLQGCWLSARRATKRLALESLELGSLLDAAFYAVTTPTDELVEPVAKAVLQRRDIGLVRDIVTRLLRSANLRRHFTIACELLHELADAIPDEALSRVFGWLLPRFGAMPDGAGGNSTLNMAWKLLKPMADRLPAHLARQALQTAFAHPAWTTRLENTNGLIIEREQMVKAVNRLALAAGHEDLCWIAQESLPLALERKQMHDYPDVVNLLCNLANRGGTKVKEQVGAALFPSGKSLDRILIQVAPQSRDEPPSAEKVAALAKQIATEIRLQVQLVPQGEKPVQVPETVMAQNETIGELTRVTSLVGGVGLHAVARHRQQLSANALDEIVAALLAMAKEPENFLANRTTLLQGLRQFADRVDARARQEICLDLEPIAQGEIVESSGRTSAEGRDPLNPFKFDFGQPEKLQTAALVTLVEFARTDTVLTRHLWPVLEEAFYATNPEVRRGAFAAAAKIPETPPDTILLAILTGSRDPDPDVASASFFALAKQPSWELTRNHWRIFLHGLRLAAQSSHDNMRRNAAWAAALWADHAPTKGFQANLAAILQRFREDILASVREAAHAISSASTTAAPPVPPGKEPSAAARVTPLDLPTPKLPNGQRENQPLPADFSPPDASGNGPAPSPALSESDASAADNRETRFHQLAEQWRIETAHLSNIRKKALHPAYQEIIGMGEAAVPLILEEMKRNPGQWFWALHAITRADPIAEESRGKLREMTEAWLEWGRNHGYKV